jgi:hypothetical protein
MSTGLWIAKGIEIEKSKVLKLVKLEK